MRALSVTANGNVFRSVVYVPCYLYTVQQASSWIMAQSEQKNPIYERKVEESIEKEFSYIKKSFKRLSRQRQIMYTLE